MSSFEYTISVLNITDANDSFSITLTGHWESESAEKTFDGIIILLKLSSLELQVKEVSKRGNQIKLGDTENKISDFDTQKLEILEELKNVKYNDPEDLVYRMQLTYDEVINIVETKCIPTKRTDYSLNPRIHEVVDLNDTLKHILPDNVKVTITIDGTRLKSNLKIIQTSIFPERSFFYYTRVFPITFLSFRRHRRILPIDCGII